MELIVQPADGIKALLETVAAAQKSIDIMIFRFDLKQMEKMLEGALSRGVAVRALIARESSQGDKRLRQLEMRWLEKGIIVARTGEAFVRYHGKMMIVDNKILHVYGFNFTGLDIAKSRSFGLISKNEKLVSEASKLFAADFDRQPYTPGNARFVVSPENARERLSRFIGGARKQLLIYDPQVSDDAMLRLITERIKAGVDVRVLGKVESKWNVRSEKYPGRRLHIRAIIRDGKRAFLGSQSLRRLELEKRREVGVIITDDTVIRQMQEIFEKDWALTPSGKKDLKKAAKVEKKEKKEEKLAAAS